MVRTAAPLATRLSWLWTAWAIEIDNQVEAAGTDRMRRLFRISLPMWTNGLRLIDEDGISVADLQSGAHAACNIGGLERWGWISVGDTVDSHARRPGFGTHRGVRPNTVLRPTRAGSLARRLTPQLIDEAEGAWRSRFGVDALDALRSALATRDPSMPWSPPEVHPADGFRSRVIAGPDIDSAEPPLVAQLGQALTVATLDFERHSESSLPMCADILRALEPDPVSQREMPIRTGVSKEAIAMAVRFAARAGLAHTATDKTIGLTAAGRTALTAYRRWAKRYTNVALGDAVDTILAQHGALSAGLVAPAGGWRAEKPYAKHTARMIDDPTGTLPWQPMVLHRGGWPDGS
jgi:hypothetical protein